MSIRVTKGNVFRVKLEDGTIRYFQFIGKDKTDLNGDVIAIFNTHYSIDESDCDRIIGDSVECFMHTSVRAGLKLGFWERVFSSRVLIDNNITFRDSLDDGNYPYQHIVSHHWVVWNMNEERKYVGRLPKKYYRADVGGVFPPALVIKRMETGVLPLNFYPSY